MPNSFYTNTRSLISGSTARGDVIEDKFDGVEAGFDAIELDNNKHLQITNTSTPQVISETSLNRADKVVGFDSNGDLVLHTGITASQAAAAASASAAGTSASNALTSETNAATSETNASNSESAALSAQAAAELALNNFNDRYLGAKATDPTLDNDGNPLTDGALYWDTTNNLMKVYDLGNTSWVATFAPANASGIVNTPSGGVAATDVQAAINELDTEKAPLASPAFTGTPTGITAAHVGLGNVDNTADTAKPVSTAQQTALNLKQDVATALTIDDVYAAVVALGE